MSPEITQECLWRKAVNSALISQLHSLWHSRSTEHAPMYRYGTRSLRHVCYLAKFSWRANLLKKDIQDSSTVLRLYLGMCTYKCAHKHTSAWTETKPFCLKIWPSVSWAVLLIPFLYLKWKDKILKSSARLHSGTQATVSTTSFFSHFFKIFLKSFLKIFFCYLFLLVYIWTIWTALM